MALAPNFPLNPGNLVNQHVDNECTFIAVTLLCTVGGAAIAGFASDWGRWAIVGGTFGAAFSGSLIGMVVSRIGCSTIFRACCAPPHLARVHVEPLGP